MRSSASLSRRPRILDPLALLVAMLLVASCEGGAAPSSSAGPAATPSPAAVSPSPVVIVVPTAEPSAAPVPDSFAPGALAVTVSDDLRVRSMPEVTDDSVKYAPLLPTGTQVVITGGPVQASGYTWYRVAPLGVTLQGGVDEGWVAVADHDGTPWVALAEDPTPGFELASVQVDRPNPTKAAARTAATSVNAFGIDLYKRVLRDPSLDLGGKGVVLSPTSIAIALAMARAGARGTTASEMDAVLHTSGWDAFGTQLGALQQRLASRDAAWTDEEGETHALSLRIANAAFAQDGWPIEQPYLREIGLALGAALGLVDYVNDAGGALRAINGWVARQTANRIPNLLVPPNVRPTTRLVLVNAIYLKANWQTEFGRGHATRDRAFHRADGSVVEVPTMQLAGDQKVPYATGKGWKATELRYLGADGTTPLAMTIVMPDDLAAWERSLTPAKLAAVDSRLRQERARLQKVSYGPMPEDCGTYPYSLRLFMPRFGIDTKGDLVPALEALGIRAAVDSAQANFNGITPGGRLFIAAVIHEANIDVDEKGTEAAAATAIVMDTGGCTGPGPARTVTLRLDRPFLYFVRDLETGAIVFMGRVMDPSVRS